MSLDVSLDRWRGTTRACDRAWEDVECATVHRRRFLTSESLDRLSKSACRRAQRTNEERTNKCLLLCNRLSSREMEWLLVPRRSMHDDTHLWLEGLPSVTLTHHATTGKCRRAYGEPTRRVVEEADDARGLSLQRVDYVATKMANEARVSDVRGGGTRKCDRLAKIAFGGRWL